MTYLFPLLYFIGITLAFSFISKQKTEEVLPIGLLLSVFVLYFSQFIFSSFKAGFYFLIIVAALGYVMLLFRNGGLKNNKCLVTSTGIVSIIVAFLIFLFVDLGRAFTLWDEFMHWGKMVKEMFRLDSFYSVAKSGLITHKDYPPFSSLWELLWCYLLGKYSEMGLTMAMNFATMIFIISPVLSLVKDENKVYKKFIAVFSICWIYISIILLLDGGETFLTIYTDIFLSVIFAYNMSLVYCGKVFQNKWMYLAYVLSLMAMTLTKQIGLAFVAISLLYFLIRSLANYQEKLGKKISFVLCPIVVTGGIYLTWKFYIKSLGITGMFGFSQITPSSLKAIYLEKGLQFKTAVKFIKAIFEKNICQKNMPITFASSLLIILGAILLLRILDTKFNINKLSTKHAAIISVSFILGTIGYALAMILMYMFCFEPSEVAHFGNYPRYMSSYFIGEVLLVIYMYLIEFQEQISEKISVRIILLIALIAACIINPSNIYKEIPHFGYSQTNVKYHQLAEKLDSKMDAGKTVLMVYNQTNGNDYQVLTSYYLDDKYIDSAYMDMLHADYGSDSGTYEEALSIISQDDYIYFVQTSSQFNKYFSNLNSGKKYRANTLYKVIKNKNSVKLVKVK